MELSKLQVAQLNEAAAGAAIDTAGKQAPQHQKSLTTAAAQLMGLQDFADAQLNELHPPHHQRNMFSVKDDFSKLKTFLAERAKQHSAPTDSAVPALAAGGAAAIGGSHTSARQPLKSQCAGGMAKPLVRLKVGSHNLLGSTKAAAAQRMQKAALLHCTAAIVEAPSKDAPLSRLTSSAAGACKSSAAMKRSALAVFDNAQATKKIKATAGSSASLVKSRAQPASKSDQTALSDASPAAGHAATVSSAAARVIQTKAAAGSAAVGMTMDATETRTTTAAPAPAPAATPPAVAEPQRRRTKVSDLDVNAVQGKVQAAYTSSGGRSLKGCSVAEMQCYLRAKGHKGGSAKRADVEERLLALLDAASPT
jgi:hypothetical protein